MMTEMTRQMRSRRDEQLFEIAYARPEDGILPEAVEAARAELAARNLAPDAFEELHEQTLERKHDDASMADRHLPGWGVVAFLILGMTLIGVVAAFGLFATGRRQMGIEAIYASIFGVLIPAAIFLIAMLLTRGLG